MQWEKHSKLIGTIIVILVLLGLFSPFLALSPLLTCSGKQPNQLGGHLRE